MSKKVLLVGTGRVGAEFARAILARGGLSLRVLVRTTTSPDKVEAMRRMGVEVVVGSTSDHDSLCKVLSLSLRPFGAAGPVQACVHSLTRVYLWGAQACDGINTVVSAIHGFANPEEQLLIPQVALMRAARDMGVEQFIPSEYGTVAREGVPDGIPVCEAKRRVGEAAAELARESGGRFHYTLIRACA